MPSPKPPPPMRPSAFPVQVVAVDALGGVPRRPGAPDEAAADLLSAFGHLAMHYEGHGKCGYWAYDPERQVIACSCGRLAYQVGDPLPATEAGAA